MSYLLSSMAGAGWQFFNNDGVPLAGGKIETYLAGSTTPATTFTTSSASVANSNPIVLNAFGRLDNEVWVASGAAYKFVLKDASNNLIGTYDNLPGINDQTAVDNLTANLANNSDPAKGDALIGFRQSGPSGNLTSAVGRTVHQKLQEFVSVLDFGADPTGVADSTAAIQAAINACNTQGTTYARAQLLAPAPTYENFVIGSIPVLYFPRGTYKISDKLTYGYFDKFYGDAAIIYQTDSTKDIFWSESAFQNIWDNLVFVGGKRQIFAQNGATGVTGIEGVFLRIVNCEFQASFDFSIRTQVSGAGGGMQTIITHSRYFYGKQFAHIEGDFAEISSCWLETADNYQVDDTAWVVNKTDMKFLDNCLVPGGNYTSTTNRYIDNYGSVQCVHNRFGGEGGGGLPPVYNYANQYDASSYPYQGGVVIIRDNPTSCVGGSSKVDCGFIVLKAGLPQVIVVEGNGYSFDGPVIRTNLLNGGVSLATYLASFNIDVPHQNAKQFNISIQFNSKWGGTLTSSDADTLLLRPWMTATTLTGNYRGNLMYDVDTKYVASEQDTTKYARGYDFPQTSTSSTVSIVDTGIKRQTDGYGFQSSAIYDVYISGNYNQPGNSYNRTPQYGVISVGAGVNVTSVTEIFYTALVKENFTNVGELSVSVVFWNGSSEVSTIPVTDTTSQIRIKVGGYAAGYEGAQQNVRIVKRFSGN